MSKLDSQTGKDFTEFFFLLGLFLIFDTASILATLVNLYRLVKVKSQKLLPLIFLNIALILAGTTLGFMAFILFSINLHYWEPDTMAKLDEALKSRQSWAVYQDDKNRIRYSYPKQLGWDAKSSQGCYYSINNDRQGSSLDGSDYGSWNMIFCSNFSPSNYDKVLAEYGGLKEKKLTEYGANFVSVGTDIELSRSIPIGRYVISNDNTLLIRVDRPPSSDRAIIIENKFNQLYLEILKSVERY